ncbi:poly [ADP-ribose] polymerase 1-like [Centruroides sculpturatus]|uniref:poly [ADP-ribose] polymerase 1-like n=1 Tax=Centruroides sculpturatus TaxID=218467 RepID=UPI000C6D7A67|nr:poly [ADP-ribose] polymerase 1-like [Centruroides sculpturatus]
MYERTRADYITKLPPNMHSTKGCGATIPDPKQVIKNDDGLVIPAGKPVNSKISNGDLLYNEYIIYDTAQVNIKYLLKVKFNWKR